MSKTLDNTNKLKEFIFNKFKQEEIDNDSLVQIIELCGFLLNLQTISDYSKNNDISYNGAKKFRKSVKLFNVKFIIDNE
jgi:hypothetical protein